MGGTERPRVAAMAGNPNVGKSTVFNALTGLHQHTGNWAGKTVTNARGYWAAAGYELVDLPGTYSLLARSAEEAAARQFLCFAHTDAVVVVCDATCLERNLNLALQIMELPVRVVLCVNLMDEAARKGIRLDLPALAAAAGGAGGGGRGAAEADAGRAGGGAGAGGGVAARAPPGGLPGGSGGGCRRAGAFRRSLLRRKAGQPVAEPPAAGAGALAAGGDRRVSGCGLAGGPRAAGRGGPGAAYPRGERPRRRGAAQRRHRRGAGADSGGALLGRG